MFPSLPPVQKTAERKGVLLASKSNNLINRMQHNAIYVPLALLSQHLGCQSWKYKTQAIVLPCFLTSFLTLAIPFLLPLETPAHEKHIHTLRYGSRYPILALPKMKNVQILASGHHQVPTKSVLLSWLGHCSVSLCYFYLSVSKALFEPLKYIDRGKKKEKTDNREYQHLPFSNLEKATDLRLHW